MMILKLRANDVNDLSKNPVLAIAKIFKSLLLFHKGNIFVDWEKNIGFHNKLNGTTLSTLRYSNAASTNKNNYIKYIQLKLMLL